MEKVDKFFHPKVHTGWHKGDSIITRRRRALKAHKKDYLVTAKSLQSLSNVSKDKTTSRLAGVDARYFFRKHKELGI